MIEEIKKNVMSIYTKLYGEVTVDESYVLDFTDITKREVAIVMEDGWMDCYNKVILDTIVITEEDIYMTGLTDNGESVDEIYFESIDTDKMASIADIIWDRNYKL
jgi:hypothetical protein